MNAKLIIFLKARSEIVQAGTMPVIDREVVVVKPKSEWRSLDRFQSALDSVIGGRTIATRAKDGNFAVLV